MIQYPRTQGCAVGGKTSDSDFPKFPNSTPNLLKSTEIVVHSKKSLFQQNFRKKLYLFN